MAGIRNPLERSNAKVTLANRYASRAALRYSRALRNFEKPDVESNPTFISLALLEVSGDALLEREVLQGDSLLDNFAVIF